LTEARTIFEPELARLAALRANEADLKAMEELVATQEEDLRSGVLTRKHDIKFHTLVANAGHNPVLTIVVSAIDEAIRDPILRSKLTPEMRAGVVGYHRSLFEAIHARDTERAYNIMKEHVAAVQRHLRESESEEAARGKRPGGPHARLARQR
jgi:DNA-binding FadR family transcriptional regulator